MQWEPHLFLSLLMLSLFVLFASLAELAWGKSVPAGPTIQLGKTTLVGRDIAFLGQEFFGGACCHLPPDTSLSFLQIPGIPYARPPLGNLRLRPPVLTTSLDDNTFNATQFGLACLQLVQRLFNHFALPLTLQRVSLPPRSRKIA